MADDKFKSLLSPNTSWLDVARGAFGRTQKQRKTQRNAMLGLFALDLWEANKLAKVQKNLQELEEQKVFDQAKVQREWDAYSKLIEDDKQFKKDKNYFYSQAEAEFNRLNPNFDMSLESQRDFRKQEIADYQSRIEEIHNQKMQTGNIDVKMTEEQFMKGFNDYYKSRKEDVMDPRDRSAVHQVLGFFGVGNERRAKLDEKIKTQKAALQDYSYLLDPADISGVSAIEVSRDPLAFTLNKSEAQQRIIANTQNNAALQSKLLKGITKDSYTQEELQNLIVARSINYNPEIEKARQSGETFDALYLERSGRDQLPEKGTDDYNAYILDRQDYVDDKLGMGDETSRKIRSLLSSHKQAVARGDDELAAILGQQLNEFKRDKVKETFISTTIQSLADPTVRATVDKIIQAEDNGINSDDDWVFSQLQTFDATLQRILNQ